MLYGTVQCKKILPCKSLSWGYVNGRLLVDHEGVAESVVVDDLLQPAFVVVVPTEFLQCIEVGDFRSGEF